MHLFVSIKRYAMFASMFTGMWETSIKVRRCSARGWFCKTRKRSSQHIMCWSWTASKLSCPLVNLRNRLSVYQYTVCANWTDFSYWYCGIPWYWAWFVVFLVTMEIRMFKFPYLENVITTSNINHWYILIVKRYRLWEHNFQRSLLKHNPSPLVKAQRRH